MVFKDLETKRLILKNISALDREFMFNHFTNKDINTYLFDTGAMTDIKEMDEIINMYIAKEPRALHRWIIIKKDNNEKIGSCGFHYWDEDKGTCDIGYDLGLNYQRQGYMKEALLEIMKFAESDMKIKEINACIYPENIASMEIAKKLGFIFKGETRNEKFKGRDYEHKILTYGTSL